MRITLKTGKTIKISFTRQESMKIIQHAYKDKIKEGKIKKIDFEHPTRNIQADREISFAHPEYMQTRNYYTYAHKIDICVFFTDGSIEIWETDPIPATETVGQLLCYFEWMSREHPDSEIGMNYVTYRKYSEVDYIATKFHIKTWNVIFTNGEVAKLENYSTKLFSQ